LLAVACARSPAAPPRLTLAPAELYDYLRPAEGERAVVANFWATWCAPCVAEMPHLVELERRWADEGVRVVAVSIDVPMPVEARTPEDVHEFADRRGLALPVVALTGETRDWNEVLEHYDMSGPVPYTFVVDRAGAIVARQEGGADAERFERMLRAALAPEE
jgi:thiol-disulfide isomerase/thioredoxin